MFVDGCSWWHGVVYSLYEINDEILKNVTGAIEPLLHRSPLHNLTSQTAPAPPNLTKLIITRPRHMAHTHSPFRVPQPRAEAMKSSSQEQNFYSISSLITNEDMR